MSNLLENLMPMWPEASSVDAVISRLPVWNVLLFIVLFKSFTQKDLEMSLLQVKNCNILTYTRRSLSLSREGSLSCYDLGLHSLTRRTAPFSRLMNTTTSQWVLRTCTDGKRETWRETDTIQTGADAESAWLRGAWIMKDVKESTEGLYHGASYGSRNNIAHNEGKVHWLNF